MSEINPISPKDVNKTKPDSIPPDVIEAWNRLIESSWKGGKAVIIQGEITDILQQIMNVPSSVVYQRGWLDIENLYRDVGWKVTYIPPKRNRFVCQPSSKGRFIFEDISDE